MRKASGVQKNNHHKSMRVYTVCLLFLACISVPFLTSCVTTKAYCGDKVDGSEMCLIKGEKGKTTIKGKDYLEATLLVKVDSQVVGSYTKGWPKAVKAKAGERVVEVRHYKGWEASFQNKPTIEIVSGTCRITPDYYKHYLVKFQADKSKKYIVSFKTKNPETDVNPEVVLTEEDTGKQVKCQVEILDQNSLTQR